MLLKTKILAGAACAILFFAAGLLEAACSAQDRASASPGDALGDLRTVEGKYLRLVTDSAESESLPALVATFDEAVPLWLEYWKRDASSVDGWRMTGYLMQDKFAFRRRGLIPATLPEFANGYQAGDKFWVVSQPSDFYSLHLMLHEGVHGLAQHLFGGAGPPWYMEGTAEFLATHHRGDEGLQVGIIPSSKEASPYWGRIGLIAQRRLEGKMPTIETVMRYGDTAHRDVEPYAWSWAAALLMEMYPEYRERFRAAAIRGRDASPQFTRAFYESLRPEWPVLAARWSLLCNDLDYGYDRERNRVTLNLSLPDLETREATMRLRGDHGWQSAPVKVRRGTTVEIEVSGRLQLREDPAWQADANGVTITYQRSLPLGRVVACVLPQASPAGRFLPQAQIFSIGANEKLLVPEDGWLLLKINDSPADLGNNQGELDVRIRLPAS
ncbi:MAG: hypothetical protein ACO1RT_06830 [Planctomycetaceae bacterium]